MRNPWRILRCSVGNHRWTAIRVGHESCRECRDCKERVFDGPNSDPEAAIGRAGNASGAGGISGSI